MSPIKVSERRAKVIIHMRWLTAAAALSYAVASPAAQPTQDRAPASISLQDFLDTVSQNNAIIKAAKLHHDSAALKRQQADYLELSPFLIGTMGYLNDQTQTSMPAQQGTSTSAKSYSLGVSKLFTTGTSVSAGWSQGFTDISGTQGFTILPRWESKYTLSVSQSLWKNSFGHSTRLRREGDDAHERIALLKAEGESRQALIDAEDAYWTYVMQTLDVKEKADSLKRVQKTRNWTARRLGNGIADRADLLQVDSLLTKTKLGQLDSQSKLESARKAYIDALGIADGQPAPLPNTETLSSIRPLASKTESPLRVDIWIQQFATKAGDVGAKQAADMLKPDLSVSGAFAANTRDASIGTSASGALASDHNSYQIGLKLAMSLDFSLANRIRASANADAKAARMVSEKLSRDTSSSWDELVRQHQNLSSTIDLMEQLSQNLEAKLKREQERLEIGRTITANVVNFEQELADARLLLLKTKVAQRKVEALARMYFSKSEVEAL